MDSSDNTKKEENSFKEMNFSEPYDIKPQKNFIENIHKIVKEASETRLKGIEKIYKNDENSIRELKNSRFIFPGTIYYDEKIDESGIKLLMLMWGILDILNPNKSQDLIPIPYFYNNFESFHCILKMPFLPKQQSVGLYYLDLERIKIVSNQDIIKVNLRMESSCKCNSYYKNMIIENDTWTNLSEKIIKFDCTYHFIMFLDVECIIYIAGIYSSSQIQEDISPDEYGFRLDY
jgi:hypothetical protein